MNIRVLHLVVVIAAMVFGSLPSQAQAVDVNRATQDELEALPGIGQKIASEIVREREENGPFSSIDDLARVPSMTPSILAKVKSQLRFGALVTGVNMKPRQETVVVQEGTVVSGDIVKKVLQRYAVEPTAREVQQQAIEYLRVHPEVVDSWRLRARTNALAPRLTTTGQGTLNDDRRTVEIPGDPTIVSVDNDQSGRLTVGATWELDRLIFEPAEMAVARESVRIANLRDRVLDEVTRRYFERRRLQVDLELSPPKDLADRVKKELRLQELTADIDAATGGWFSEKLKTTGQTPY
jgi:competence ComEA-like helix-hairpin-helix protein